MKIVLIARRTTLDYLVPLFTAEGHTPILFDSYTHEDKTKIQTRINTEAPDYVVNALPGLLLDSSSEYKLLQNTQASSDLEVKRYETKYEAYKRGFKIIDELESNNNGYLIERDEVQYIKPHEGVYEVVKVNANTNPIHAYPFCAFWDTPYSIEKELDYDVEAWCFFTISNGEYSIIRHIGGTGCGDSKLVNHQGSTKEAIDDWRVGITLHDLTNDQKTVFINKCKDWLDYIVTLGGNYEGCIGGYIKGSDVYWSEQNSRPGMQNIGMLPGTAMNWLNGLETDPSLSVNQVSAATIRSEKGWG
jgi:hypothetical protein